MAKKSSKKNTNYTALYISIGIAVVSLLVIIGAVISISKENSAQTNENTATVTESEVVKEVRGMDIKTNPVATIEMENGGIITVELYPDIAPNTVCNFIELANSGYYDGIIFHRCVKDLIIQGGDPEGTGMGGPGYSIFGEFTNNGFKNELSHTRGVISMARRSRPLDSAGSQFFIMVDDYIGFDGDYAAFGKVTDGMEFVTEMSNAETDENDRPLNPQAMKSVRVETFGVDYPSPEKI